MNSPLDEAEMTMPPGDLPRLTLRGRGADTLKPPKPRFRLKRSSSAPDNQHPAYRRCCSERLRHRYERGAVLVEQLDQLHEVGNRAAEPIDLVSDDDLDRAMFEVAQQTLQSGSLQRATGYPGIDVGVGNEDPALTPLAGNVGFARLLLRLNAVEFHAETFFRRDSAIDRGSDLAPRCFHLGLG